MRRREFITLIGAAAAWPLAERAEQGDRMRRVRVLIGIAANDPDAQTRLAAFVQNLQQLAWTDSRNVRIDYRWGGGDADRVRKYAAELLALRPDVVFASGGGPGGGASGGPRRGGCGWNPPPSARPRLCAWF